MQSSDCVGSRLYACVVQMAPGDVDLNDTVDCKMGFVCPKSTTNDVMDSTAVIGELYGIA